MDAKCFACNLEVTQNRLCLHWTKCVLTTHYLRKIENYFQEIVFCLFLANR